jgi:hypothetical protein
MITENYSYAASRKHVSVHRRFAFLDGVTALLA